MSVFLSSQTHRENCHFQMFKCILELWLVRFGHKNHLVRVRNRSYFGCTKTAGDLCWWLFKMMTKSVVLNTGLWLCNCQLLLINNRGQQSRCHHCHPLHIPPEMRINPYTVNATWCDTDCKNVNMERMTCTKLSVSGICRNVKYQHFMLTTRLLNSDWPSVSL